jgi:hypothetical protein
VHASTKIKNAPMKNADWRRKNMTEPVYHDGITERDGTKPRIFPCRKLWDDVGTLMQLMLHSA